MGCQRGTSFWQRRSTGSQVKTRHGFHGFTQMFEGKASTDPCDPLRSVAYLEFMSTIDKVLRRNAEFALNYDPEFISPRPRMNLAVLACMDTRITLAALGLKPQDAHFIRNAGGIVTDDALRSLLVSHYFLGTNEVMVINHTDCGLMKATEEEMHEQIERAA